MKRRVNFGRSVNIGRRNNRHGLILLIVLGMLALFSLLTVTYVAFASQSRNTSVAYTRGHVRQMPTEPLLDEAIKQLIRGTKNPDSSMWGHDILGDLYGANETSQLESYSLVSLPFGEPAIRVVDTNAPARPMILSNRFLRIPLVRESIVFPPADRSPYKDASGNEFLDRDLDDVLTGRIVTFYPGEGPLGGKSFRVVRYVGAGITDTNLTSTSSQYSITIDLLDAGLNQSHSQLFNGSMATGGFSYWLNLGPRGLCYANPDSQSPQAYRLFLNATPLNGHGLGVAADGSSQALLFDGTAAGPKTEVGLQPNAKMIRELGMLQGGFDGDTDEPIDSADFNTMFLSYTQSGATTAEHVIPSFHRAALINYLVNFKSIDTYTEEEFWIALRSIELATLRPLSINARTDNPPTFIQPYLNQQGVYSKNPKFATDGIGTLNVDDWDADDKIAFKRWVDSLIGVPGIPTTPKSWDVDNNTDGLADSIWMDIGLPLQRTPDGKLLKALVAYYVDDLDSKLDVNAAGGTAQANSLDGEAFTQAQLNTDLSASHSGVNLPQGMGVGTADISLRYLGLSDAAYGQLLTQRYRSRKGVADWDPGIDGLTDWGAPSRILHSREYPRMPGTVDFFQRHSHLPGLPIGIRGRVSIALDRLGNPLIHNYSDTIGILNNEYEARWIAEAAYQDSPYTLDEWERIYRANDEDNSELGDRLQQALGILPQDLSTYAYRRAITSRSRHLLAPQLAQRARIDASVNPSPSGAESFYRLIDSIRWLKHKFPDNSEASFSSLSEDNYRSLFPVEFQRSTPMNLNRPFGNGWDDNNNGEIDEPSELAGGNQYVLEATGAASADFKDDNSNYAVQLANGGYDLRQLYARHLYNLAQLIVPIDYQFPNVDRGYWQQVLSAGVQGSNAQARAQYLSIRGRILAQWAINVVDFRDSDAAMSRFEYDPDPTNIFQRTSYDSMGWHPNRDAEGKTTGTILNVVWGMEQPELLLTESLGLHDLRVRDGDPDPSKDRYDQYRIPQGSLFLELYAPRTTGTSDATMLPGVPRSLYALNPNPELNLSKLSPADTNNNRYPVWRVYIGNPIAKSQSSAIHKSPNERLFSPAATSRNAPTRFDLTGQLARSNVVPPSGQTWSNSSAWLAGQIDEVRFKSNLQLDRDLFLPAAGSTISPIVPNNQRMTEPDPTQARVIVFCPNNSTYNPSTAVTPGIADPHSQVFYNRGNAGVYLEGNQYLVIGPRPETFLGSRSSSKPAETGTITTAPTNEPNRNKIVLNPTWASMWREDGSPNGLEYRKANQNVRNAVTMIAGANIPGNSDWQNNVPEPFSIYGVGLNVSEPLSSNKDVTAADAYYKKPTDCINEDGGFDTDEDDGYHDFSNLTQAPSRAPFDQGAPGTPLNFWDKNFGPTGALVTGNIGSDNPRQLTNPGTALDWCTAYLQRLADPDRPWDAVSNPYLTVDWIPIDLTVFSGEEEESRLGNGFKYNLASRQKSGQLVESSATVGMRFVANSPQGQTFFSAVTHAPRRSDSQSPTPPDPVVASNGTFLKYQIPGDPTNLPYQPSAPTLETRRRQSGCTEQSGTGINRYFVAGNESFATLGFLNSTYYLTGEAPGASVTTTFVGSPIDTNATWHPATLFWANRPFVNSFELAYVPLSSPGQLGQEFSSAKLQNNKNPYLPSDDANSGYSFTHVLNFFQKTPDISATTKDVSLAQLFSFVDTPSAWADVEAVQPPETFWLPGNSPEINAGNTILSIYRAPYNILTKAAEPGRINLNTVSEEAVFNGLMRDPLGNPGAALNPSWNDFKSSRRGYPGNSDTLLNNDRPTQFTGAFKPISEAGMIPTYRNSSGLPELQNPVHTSLLRSAPGPNDYLPLFRGTTLGQNQPHAFADFYPISRLQKLTTDKSNVFAVYITIGLFDVENDNQGNMHIAGEYGVNNGQVRRFKMFSIIDRSIPVGYRVGEDHNTENTILLRRILSK